MSRSFSVRVRLAGIIFLVVAPASVLMYLADKYYPHTFLGDVPWPGLVIGMLALGAAWYGGERYIIRQLDLLAKAAQRLREGDLASRSGLAGDGSELGQLARTFDAMAATLERRVKERERAEKNLLNRAFQQTVVGALGQFAIVSKDVPALLDQAVMLVAQTLEVQYCNILELSAGGRTMMLRAGTGWRHGSVGTVAIPTDPRTQSGFTLTAGEPVVVEDLATETRFRSSALLIEHGVVSGVTVAIQGQGRALGILGAHSTERRKFTEDEIHFLLSIASVLAMAVEQKRAEAEMQKLASFAQLNPNPAMELAADGTITYFNDAAFMLALSAGHGSPRGIMPPNVAEIVRGCVATRQSRLRLETKLEGRTFSWSFHPVLASRIVHCYVEDITERLGLEAQLRQAQKMESVGQLAAGVAHDFNNMLTVIQGHAGILQAQPDLPQSVRNPAQAIFFAAERAAGLTRQLLMFSRKNVMQPRLLDLREVVGNISKMLQRLLGETIVLEFCPPAQAPLMHGDPGMVEQVLMNLAVNARDAMPKGGSLTISTEAILIDKAYIQLHPEARPGVFLRLRVTDTGCGMDAATLSRIFEPFFTTKEVGKGTGLGLATVYGIVKQHEGWVEVESEVGRGSTFTVYFPARAAAVQTPSPAATSEAVVRGGQETILVVEDEPVLRNLAQVILEERGYRVLEASSGVEAIKVWTHHAGIVDLVVTDMVMPDGISGMELAERLLPAKPDLKIVFASGYSMDDLDTDFIRQGRALFLQKPYTHVTLAKAVRECLDKVN